MDSPSTHMAEEEPVLGMGDLAVTSPPRDPWPGSASCGGWATALVLLFLLFWRLLRSESGRRRQRHPPLAAYSTADTGPTRALDATPTSGISTIISEEDLKLLINNLEGNFKDVDRWENVIDKKNDQLSYSAKCCKPKDAPLKYLSVTIFEKCSVEILRDFYMDNEYRKKWDRTLVDHEQLEVDLASGTEVGRTIKKFPLLTQREYILAWRVWEGKNKTFYCVIKDCEHPLAPQQKKYVRVRFFRSGWRIRKVPDRDACEIKMVHQEDAGLNVEMAKLAFAKGIWSYVCKMNTALREYSLRSHRGSISEATSLRIIQVPPSLESDIVGFSSSGALESSGGDGAISRQVQKGDGDDAAPTKSLLRKPSKTWIAKSLLVIGGIICLSRGHSALGTQLAVACILKKLTKNGEASSDQAEEPARLSRGRRGHRHRS